MKRSITLSTAGLAAVALLSGCSTGTPAAGPASAVAPTTTAGAPAASGNTTPAGSSNGPVATSDVKTLLKQMMTGQKTLKTYTATIESSMKSSGISSSTKSVTVCDQTNPDAPRTQTTADSTMTMSGSSTPTVQHSVMMSDGKTFYTKEEDGSWSKSDLDMPTPSAMSSGAQEDERIDRLAAAIKEPKLIGEELVNGTPTKHYQFTANLDQRLSGFGASPAVSMAPSEKATTMTTQDYWLDGNGVPIKSSVKVGDTMTTTVLSKINEPVQIDIPTNATVRPMPTDPGMSADPTKK